MIALGALVKKPGDELDGEPVELVVSEASDPAEMGAYEELLYDAIRGNSARFARQDYVEEAWRIVDPILGAGTAVHEYERGTWGPPQADALIARDGGWFDPTPEPIARARHALSHDLGPRQLAQDMPMARMPATLNTAIHVMTVKFSRGSQPRLAMSQ
jgi:glucose-6-phosphate 1-dehydrogenase